MAMQAFILLGAPGSGKGTVAEKIRAQTAYLHIATGDMLREAVKKGTPVGREAEGFMKRGELVPDEVMIRLVEERLDHAAGGAFMFDGFPRTVRQAELLDASLARRGGGIRHVLLLETPRDVLIGRLAGRRVCRQCGATYHVVNIPPRKTGVCDACGGELYQRADDNEATVINRLDVYNRQTATLVDYYRSRNLLRPVNSDQGVDRLVAELLGILGAKASVR